MAGHRRRFGTLLAAFVATATTLGLSVPAAATPAMIRIDVLSSRADLVTGGDALVEVTVRRSAGRPVIGVDGRDVSNRFTPQPDGTLLGLVDGLRIGANEMSAHLPFGSGAYLTLVNHPIGGPLFAGPQVRPWICGTEAAGLGQPVDAQCDAPTRYSYVYRNTVTGTLLPYDPAHPPLPALVAKTTTDQGVTVPYVVRIETGTMDRGIYQLAVLSTLRAWNHKLITAFDGGSGAYHTQQAPPQSDVLNDFALGRGFLVATSGLLVHAYNENQVVSAEVVAMLKEHVIKRYGRIRYTIGSGCSGGSIQQYMIAAMYPGLLDGIQPECSFPDLWTTATEVTDCHLLLHYFNSTSPQLWLNPAQRAAVDGHQSAANCGVWETAFGGLLNPAQASNCDLPANDVYPTGVRCAVQDYQQDIWGTRRQDGFAERPLDNTGVQYGLDALNAGKITPDQFLDLNAKVGGMTIDWQFQPDRTHADPGVAQTAYRTSEITDARQLATGPIIDLRPYIETEIHTSFHSYELRARLDRDNGGHGNQAIWTFPVTNLVAADLPGSIAQQSLLLIDRWLSNLERDTSGAPQAVKVIRDKPSAATDTCWINGAPTTDATRCAAAYPHYGDTRIAAGESLTDDILQCRLTPVNRAGYRVPFTDAQWARLRGVFPNGVCDWTRPGIGQHPSTPWLTYVRPGGQPLGPPPVSRPGP